LAAFSRIRGENVHFNEERVPVYWGDFSQVQAILLLLRTALENLQHFDYFVLMSGCDYPLRSGDYIRQFLAANRGLEFMNLVKVPSPGKPLSRITTLRYPCSKPVLQLVVRALAKFGFARRDHRNYFGAMEPYSGSTWWALTRDACQYLMEFIDRNQRMCKFFENVFAADEAFLQTILGNSPFMPRIRRNLLFEDWSTQGAHPATIDGEHVALFEVQNEVRVSDVYGEGEVLFARKFSDSDLDLLKRIDNMIEQKERRARRAECIT